jgi:hypothetical protein
VPLGDGAVKGRCRGGTVPWRNVAVEERCRGGTVLRTGRGIGTRRRAPVHPGSHADAAPAAHSGCASRHGRTGGDLPCRSPPGGRSEQDPVETGSRMRLSTSVRTRLSPPRWLRSSSPPPRPCPPPRRHRRAGTARGRGAPQEPDRFCRSREAVPRRQQRLGTPHLGLRAAKPVHVAVSRFGRVFINDVGQNTAGCAPTTSTTTPALPGRTTRATARRLSRGGPAHPDGPAASRRCGRRGRGRRC